MCVNQSMGEKPIQKETKEKSSDVIFIAYVINHLKPQHVLIW